MPAIVPEDLQNQIVSAVRKGNEYATTKIKTAAGAVKAPKLPATPKLPEGKLDVAKIRQGAVDYAGKLPAPVDVVESAFGLADRVVDSQRKLVDSQRKRAGVVIDKAAAALRPAAADAKPTAKAETKAEAKPAAKPAAKAAAKPAAKTAAK